MEDQGIRPAKESFNQTLYSSMDGAYPVYVHNVFGSAGAQTYYLAKWIRLSAGDYTLRYYMDDYGDFLLDGAPGAHLEAPDEEYKPKETTFTVTESATYRLDVTYSEGPGETPAYVAYALYKDGKVVEVSRASGFLGDTQPIPDSALGPRPPYSDDERLTYPVFLPVPNWSEGVTERVEWLTDVMQSESGAEQRRPVRLHPRRSFEASFLRWGVNRAVLDATLTGVGQREIILPLWHDMTASEGDAVAGSVDLYGQFRYKDFNIGDVVVLRRDLEWNYETNIVAGLDLEAGHMTLQFGVQNDVGRGTRIYPARVAQIREAITTDQKTDAVGVTQVRMYCTDLYTMDPSLEMFPVFGETGLPIFTLPENWGSSADISTDRVSYSYDNQSGPVVMVDPGNQSWNSVKKSYTIHGRVADRKFRQMLFALQGRTKTFHLPLGTSDFTLARDIDPTDGALVVKRCGYTQFLGGSQKIRTFILVELYNGQKIPARIISSRVVGNEEWLFLSQSIPAAKMNQVLRIGYMPISRLDVDTIEINRLTDSAGVSKISLTFKSFDDRREASPIPLQ